MIENVVWVEKYRPKTVAECILPARMKKQFSEYAASGDGAVPNMLFSGKSGVGKTTLAKALLSDMGCDSIVINASLHGNIDTLRVDVTQFASSVSLGGKRKFVILDEADYLNANSTQPALRNFIEEYSSNCGFILTCNYPNRILESIRSRMAHVDFTIGKDEAPSVMKAFMDRACSILEAEGVKYDKQVVASLVAMKFPDFRKVLNELQSHSRSGMLETSVLGAASDFDSLVDLLRDRDFTGVRKWVAENGDVDAAAIARGVFERMLDRADPPATAAFVVLAAKYQYQEAFVADKELNAVAMLVETMSQCDFR